MKPIRYLLLWVEDGETRHEFAHRDDVIERIREIKARGATVVEAFVDARLTIGFAITLEGVNEPAPAPPAPLSPKSPGGGR